MTNETNTNTDDTRKQSKNEMTATGRRASFRIKMKSEEDVQPAINRIAQYLFAVARDPDVELADVGVKELIE